MATGQSPRTKKAIKNSLKNQPDDPGIEWGDVETEVKATWATTPTWAKWAIGAGIGFVVVVIWGAFL